MNLKKILLQKDVSITGESSNTTRSLRTSTASSWAEQSFLLLRRTEMQQPAARLYSSSALPPHNLVLLPALSPTMELGTIVSWEKDEGT